MDFGINDTRSRGFKDSGFNGRGLTVEDWLLGYIPPVSISLSICFSIWFSIVHCRGCISLNPKPQTLWGRGGSAASFLASLHTCSPPLHCDDFARSPSLKHRTCNLKYRQLYGLCLLITGYLLLNCRSCR